MRKLLSIVLFFITALTASAQGVWSTGMNEADELKGLLGGPYYRYDVEGMGSFILWDWEDWKFRIITDKGLFDSRISSSGNYYVSISMGLYSPDGKLTDTFENSIEVDNISRNTATINKNWMYFPNDRKKIKKMIRAIKSGEGFVRIVCKRTNASDFDLRITKYDISKENSTAYKEFTQVLNRSTQFYDENDYSTPDDVVTASRNNNLRFTTLKKGERFKVLSIAGQQLMLAKVQLPNGKIGWIYPLHVPNKKDFLPHLSFRDKYLPNIENSTVAPGMTREEIFIITGNYLSPEDKSYKAHDDYIWYNYTNANYLFYKNSLYFATNCNGAFYYQCFVDYKLTNVIRNDSAMDNNITDNATKNYKDELLSVAWVIDRNRANFIIKNNAPGSIKISWDDMAFVDINGESHRIIHKGIKYSEKEKEQAPSIIARNTELHDLIIPADKIYYQKSWEKWSAYPFVDDFLYSPEDESTKHPNGKKIQVLLPVIVNEKRYEYQFEFEIDNIKYSLMNFDYYRSSRVADELR